MFAAQNNCNSLYKTAPRSNVTNEGTRASNVTIASFYISCQIFHNKNAVLCITEMNMLYISWSFLFLCAKNKSKHTLNDFSMMTVRAIVCSLWNRNVDANTFRQRSVVVKYYLKVVLLVRDFYCFGGSLKSPFLCPAVQGFFFFYDFSWIS